MAYEVTPSARDRAYLRRWMDRHRRGEQPTPLLTARLVARRRGERIEWAAVATVAVGFVGWLVWSLATGAPQRGTAASLALIISVYVLLYAGSLLALRFIRHADRRIGEGLPHRVARPTAVNLPRMVGGWFLAAAVTIYLGGMLVGGLGTWLASDPTDRAVAAVFVIGLAVFGGSAAAVLADVSQRPAVAQDAASLADDDVLRREDAHRAVTPMPAIIALVAGVGSRSGDALLLAYLGYAALSFVLFTISMTVARHATAGPTVRGRR